jgi:non-ribosomal peptide synthase protein (TIGR01720 family)
MRHFTQLGGNIRRLYQAVVLQTPPALTATELKALIRELAQRHPALRMRIEHVAGTEWRAVVGDPRDFDSDDCVHHVDVAGLGDIEIRDAVAGRLGDLFPVRDGAIDPVLEVVFFDAGPGRPGRLLVVVHHFAVDGVSWRILTSDLRALWRSAQQRVEARPRASGTSFRRWARTLAELAQGGERRAELEVWRGIASTQDRPWTDQALDPARDTVGSSRTLTVTMPPGRCTALLAGVPAGVGGTVGEALIGALGLAVADWRRRRGRGGDSRVLIDVETHGREEFAGGMDLARAVGWFTAIHPAVLDIGPRGEYALQADGADLEQVLDSVRTQMRSVPDNGLGYGILRYLDSECGRVLAELGRPQIRVNYLGRFPVGRMADWASAPGFPALIAGIDTATPVEHLVQFDAYVEDHPDGPRLVAHFAWPERQLSADEARDLADTWFAVLDRLASLAGIRELADTASPTAPVIDFGNRSRRRPVTLFCIHPVEGTAWCYEGLAKALDKDVRAYGFQARGLDGASPAAPTIGEMVVDYVNRMRAIQPHGPYRILGWSFGGVLAHAVAAHLQRLGESVAFLAILDAAPAVDLDLGEHSVTAGSCGDVLANNVRLAASFASGMFDGDVLFVTAVNEPGSTEHPEKWHRHVTGAVVEHRVCSDHEGLLDPGPAADIARAVSARLLAGVRPSAITTSTRGVR